MFDFSQWPSCSTTPSCPRYWPSSCRARSSLTSTWTWVCIYQLSTSNINFVKQLLILNIPITQCPFPAFFLLVTSLYCIKFSNYFTLTIKNLLNQTLSYRILVLKWWILGFCTCICPIYQTAYREWLGVLCRGLVNLGLVTPYPRLASVFHEKIGSIQMFDSGTTHLPSEHMEG